MKLENIGGLSAWEKERKTPPRSYDPSSHYEKEGKNNE